jgi:uncharacterized protein YbjT (DUF2867 family)
MIWIIGASSTVGRETIPLLREADYQLRLSSRNPEKLQAFRGERVEIVQADLLDKASLQRACNGVEKILASTHSLLGRGKNASKHVDVIGNKNLIDVACEQGVAHFVFISILGANLEHPIEFFRNKARTEAYLKQSGLSYTILRPAAFFVPHTILRPRAFFEPEAELKAFLEGSPARIMGSGENPRNFVANADVAKFASIALTEPKAVNQIIEIGGPENLTAREVAAIYARVTGHDCRIRTLPLLVPRLMHILLKPFRPGLVNDRLTLVVPRVWCNRVMEAAKPLIVAGRD